MAATEVALPVPLVVDAGSAAAGGSAGGSAAGSAGGSAATARKDSTLVWPPSHRYAREAQELVTSFKAYVAEDPRDARAGWTVLDTKKEVVISKKTGSTPLGLLRGDGVIAGYSPSEVYPVVSLPACRKIWDDLFEEGRPVEQLDASSILSYAATKGQWPTSGRDLAVVLVNEFCEDGRIYTMSVSVTDDKLPAVKGRVRAQLKLNGWYLEPIRGAQPGTRVVYLNEIDLNGWIPEAILKIVALQVPLAVADVRKYLTRFGPPAWISLIAGETVESPAIDHDRSRLDAKIRVDNTVQTATKIGCNKQRYPNGVIATVAPADIARIEWSAAENALLLHHDDASKNGTVVTVSVEPGTGGKVVVNGTVLFPLAGIAGVAAAAAGAEPSAAVAQPTPSGAAAPPDTAVQLEDVMRRLDRIERALAEARTTSAKAASTTTARLGLAFLAGVPIVAFLAARFT